MVGRYALGVKWTSLPTNLQRHSESARVLRFAGTSRKIALTVSLAVGCLQWAAFTRQGLNIAHWIVYSSILVQSTALAILAWDSDSHPIAYDRREHPWFRLARLLATVIGLSGIFGMASALLN